MKSLALVFVVLLVIAGMANGQCTPQPPNLAASQQTCWVPEDPQSISSQVPNGSSLTWTNALRSVFSAVQRKTFVPIQTDRQYRLSVNVTALAVGDSIPFTVMHDAAPWESYGVWLVAHETGQHWVTFNATATDAAARLTAQFGTTLSGGYTNFQLDDPLLCPSQNGLLNGTFSCGPSGLPPLGWKVNDNRGLGVTATVDPTGGYNGNPCVIIHLPATLPSDIQPWEIQLQSDNTLGPLSWTKDGYYGAHAYVSTTASGSLTVELNHPDWQTPDFWWQDTLPVGWSEANVQGPVNATTSQGSVLYDLAGLPGGTEVRVSLVTFGSTTAVDSGNRPGAQSSKPAVFIKHDVRGYSIETTTTRPGSVTASIYNVQGRLIRSVGAFTPAGSSSLHWDDRAVPAGVYLVRVTTPNMVSQYKIVVVR